MVGSFFFKGRLSIGVFGSWEGIWFSSRSIGSREFFKSGRTVSVRRVEVSGAGKGGDF